MDTLIKSVMGGHQAELKFEVHLPDCFWICRGDVAISSSEDEDFAEKVKEVTGGELAYGGIDAVAGSTTGIAVLGGALPPSCAVYTLRLPKASSPSKSRDWLKPSEL